MAGQRNGGKALNETTFGKLAEVMGLRRFVVLDIETTGLSPRFHEILELGALRVVRGEDGRHQVESVFSLMVNPGRSIPKLIRDLTGITSLDVDGAPSPQEALEQLENFLGDWPVLGYNVGWDCRFLDAKFQQYLGRRFPCGNYDLLPLARRLLSGLPNHKLDTVARHFHIDVQGHHRAYKDCEMTLQFLEALRRHCAGLAASPGRELIPDRTGPVVHIPCPRVHPSLEEGQGKWREVREGHCICHIPPEGGAHLYRYQGMGSRKNPRGSACEVRVELPNTAEGRYIEFMDRECCGGLEGVTEVILPGLLRKMGERALAGSRCLANLRLPSHVECLGDHALADCPLLSYVALPNGLKSIGDGCFRGCESLTGITLPMSLERIGAWAFYGCSSLVSLMIPKGVRRLEEGVFADCHNLLRVTLMAEPDYIDARAFMDSPNVQVTRLY